MNGLLLAFGCSFFCVFSRAFLNAIDRSILKNPEVDFFSLLLLNAIFPLLYAILPIFYLDAFHGLPLWDYRTMMGGLAAQVAGSAYSLALKKMPVRGVITINKSADLVIPIVLLLAFSQFSTVNYLFSNLTTLALLPVGWSALKREQISISHSLVLLMGLLFQAIVSFYFSTGDLTQNLISFLQFLFCVLFWRTLFISAPMLFKIKRFQILSAKTIGVLVGRGLLSFLSQGAFFFAVMGKWGIATWPILNAGPLLSCYCAHLLIKEKTWSAERISTVLFCLVVFGFIFYHRSP